ncbi:MAG: lysophospholipid acyltransferase family protein [Elusimicrobiota bacterium]
MKTDKRQRGNTAGLWFFKMTVHLFGVFIAYGFLYFVCLYYLIFDQPAVCSAMPYIKRRFAGSNFFVSYWRIYRLFLNQGRQLIDKYALISGAKKYNFKVYGAEEIQSLLADGRGMILLTAHLGNWQAAISTLDSLGRPVYLVMKPEDNRAVKDYLKINEQWKNVQIISQEQYLGGVIEIMAVLKNGGIVSIMGDRRYGSKTTEIDFMGGKAMFPCGAFTIAFAAQCPMSVLLTVKTARQTYSVNLKNIIYPYLETGENKPEKIKNSMRKFGKILEQFIAEYPYQCYLFTDLWNPEPREEQIE